MNTPILYYYNSFAATGGLPFKLSIDSLNAGGPSRILEFGYTPGIDGQGLWYYTGPFTIPIKCSAPIKCSSRVKLSASIKINNYEVKTAVGTNAPQTRITSYNVSGPTYVKVSKVVVAQGEIQIPNRLPLPVTSTNSPYIDSLDRLNTTYKKVILKLPNVDGYVKFISPITVDAHNYLRWPAFKSQTVIAESFVPSASNGLLPNDFTGVNQIYKSPIGIAWGLLHAIDAQDDQLVLSILKAFAALPQDSVGGFASRFLVGYQLPGQNPSNKYLIQNIYDVYPSYTVTNIGVTSSLPFTGPITSVIGPTDPTKFYGIMFNDTAGTISPSVPTVEPDASLWRASHPDYYDNYSTYTDEIPLANSSLTRESFGNGLLGIALCKAINYLQDRIPLGSVKFEGSYESFRDNLLLKLKSLAEFCAYSVDPISNWSASYYSSLGGYSYGVNSVSGSATVCIFLSQYLDLQYDAFLHELAARLYLTISDAPKDLSNSFYDRFVERDYANVWAPTFDASLLTNPTFLRYYYNMGACCYLQLWAGHYQLDYDFMPQFVNNQAFYNLPSEFDSLATYVARSSAVNSGFSYTPVIYDRTNVDKVFIQYVVLDQLIINSSSLLLLSHLDLKAKDARAKTTAELLEIRRMWPLGPKWTGDAQNNINTVIGSMLYAQSQIGFQWNLANRIISDANAPIKARSYKARGWLELFFFKTGLVSGTFSASWVERYLTRTRDTQAAIAPAVEQVLGVLPTLTYPIANPFSVYTSLEVESYYADSYTNDTATFSYGSMPDLHYFSIAYNIVKVVSPNVPITYKLVLRRVPGFPHKTASAYAVSVGNRVTADDYLANPRTGVQVIDGEMLIEPIANYVPNINITIPTETTDYLLKMLDGILPAGVSITITTTRDING